MKKFFKFLFGWSFEGLALLALLIGFAVVLSIGWGRVAELRQGFAKNAAMIDIDATATQEIEQLRRLADSLINNSRTYFLMGSNSFFERQKEERQAFADRLSEFGKRYQLDQAPEVLARIEEIRKQEQEFFDQGVKFRDEKTESKIVGQFYNAKTAPLLKQIQENLDELSKLHESDLQALKAEAKYAGAAAQARIPEEMQWFSAVLAALFLAQTVLILRMMRRRHVQLRERDRLVDTAKSALLSRDEVLSALVNDFKGPLEDLSTVAEGLSQTKLEKKPSEYADFVKGTAVEIQGLIDDIYDLKKSDLKEVTLRLDQLPIGDILDEAQMVLQPLAKKNDINLQIESVNPSILAFADRERVIRVLINLVGNSIKFTKRHSKIAIKVRSDQQFVQVSIADSGPGIPEAQLTNIFDEFWQASKTSEQGAGVGLSIVKSVIQAHGGSVQAERNINGGTTFTFTLPRRRPVGAFIKKPAARVLKKASPVEPEERMSEGLEL